MPKLVLSASRRTDIPAFYLPWFMNRFDHIAKQASNAGITDCITSLVNHYRKVQRRFRKHFDLLLPDPPMPEKIALVRRMANTCG